MHAEEKFYLASQWQLMWRKLIKHKLAVVGAAVLTILYFIAVFREFFSPHDPSKFNENHVFAPPQKIHFFDERGRFHLRPFVYGTKRKFDPQTWRLTYTEDKSKKSSLILFVHGDKYRLWNLFEADLHLFGVKGPGTIFLFGTERLGRDLLSRIFYASRISLSIGLIGVSVSFVLGCILGGISGYYGGTADMIIQRVIEYIMSIPTLPLWMALAAVLPRDWSQMKIYFGIVLVLSVVGWCGLARVVRGKLLQTREEDFVIAAKIAGASEVQMIASHLLPSSLSYLIVSLTLSLPKMILAESTLSFIGLGLRPPVVSFGVLLQEAQNVQTLVFHYWILIPGVFVIITVLAFNFLGDGLRDACDPYK